MAEVTLHYMGEPPVRYTCADLEPEELADQVEELLDGTGFLLKGATRPDASLGPFDVYVHASPHLLRVEVEE